MGRFNVIKELLEILVRITGIHLQAWMAPAFILALSIMVFPTIRRSHRTAQARKRLRLVPYRRLAERRQLEDEALALVEGNPSGQLAVAQEALKLGRKELASRALAAMSASGRYPREQRLLAQQLEEPAGHTALDTSAAIERLIEQGMLTEAHRRLDLARKRWPEVAEWPEIPAGHEETSP